MRPNASRYVASYEHSYPASSSRSNCLLPILIFWIVLFTILIMFGLSDAWAWDDRSLFTAPTASQKQVWSPSR